MSDIIINSQNNSQSIITVPYQGKVVPNVESPYQLNDNLYDYNFKMVYGYYYAVEMIGKTNGV